MGQLDYALIGNCQSSALVDRRGRIVWCCMPRFDSEALFASLLSDDEAGVWSIQPESDGFEVRQRYLQNTNVLRTEYHLKNGDRFDLYDFMPRFSGSDGYYRAPQIVRIIRVVKGNPRVRVRFSPKFDYGRVAPEVSVTSEGLAYRRGSTVVFLKTDVPESYVLDGQAFELTGDRYFLMSYGSPFERALKFAAEEFLERTTAYWRTWVKHCSIPFEYQDAVIRSALALKLHIFEDTGAIIAATTTSIPESPDGGRTWDYRYCWLRDAYFVINVLNKLGHFEEMERFIQFLHNIAATEPGAELQPVYGIGGERELTERELPWLKGFGGIGPVRVGNAAYAHAQHDVYGEMVLAVAPLFFDARLERIDPQRAFENVRRLVEQAVSVFDKPDAGIWEFRSEKRHYVFSKLMCWAALDRGIKIATRVGAGADAEQWSGVRERMRERIESQGWDAEKGFYTQVLGGAGVPDASNLLMTAVNFHPPTDPKVRSMVESYEKLLMNQGYAFRYRNPDDFGVPKHAFTICTFWMVDALAGLGRMQEARDVFAGILARSNHVGLLSEDCLLYTSPSPRD